MEDTTTATYWLSRPSTGGRVAVGVVGALVAVIGATLGLIAFGLYGFAEARWRRT